MKSTYAIRIGKGKIARATTSPTDQPGVTLLDWLYVPPECRGMGLARKILDQVLVDADAEGQDVRLVSHACADPVGRGLGQRKLDAFYERAGFAATGEFDEAHEGWVFMRRSA